MNVAASGPERVLILAPYGRDAAVAAAVLREAGLDAEVCPDIGAVRRECEAGAGAALIVEEVLQEDDYSPLARWVETQPPWSDFPVIVLARRGGGLERNPAAERYGRALGNVSFLERPFHPTTLVSIVQTALRGRRRQYEARERLETLRGAIHRQQQDQTHLRLLINELNHRVKNTLAIVQGIAWQSFRTGGVPETVREAFEGRLTALAAAHDVLTRQNWEAGSILHIVAEATAPHHAGDGRLTAEGPSVDLEPKTAVALALAMHELATNAVKYGALSTPGGRVEVRWTADGGMLRLTWRESGGPPVAPAAQRGFGARLLEHGLAAELGGEVTLDFRPEGLICRVEAALGS